MCAAALRGGLVCVCCHAHDSCRTGGGLSPGCSQDGADVPSLSWRAQDGHDETPQNGKHSAERSARVLTGRCWMAENFPVRSLLWLAPEAHTHRTTHGWCMARIASVS